MQFFTLVQYAKRYFPQLNISYKDNSLLMKILNIILFFNKDFMTEYVTTIKSTIYFPKESYIKYRPLSSTIILLHELVHIYDSNKISYILFSLLYLFPQSLILLSLFSLKIALISLICLLPLPAYFRMYFERRAYFASLYAMQALGNKFNFDPALDKEKEFFLSQFKDSSYYFMWLFPLNKQFDNAIVKIKNNQRPFESPIFDILDDLIRQVQK